MRRILGAAGVAAAAALLAAGCGDGPLAVLDGPVTGAAAGSRIVLANGSIRPVNYFVIDRNAVALVDWVACAGPTCPAVPPRGSLGVPYDSIAFYSAATIEVNVYWWYSVPDGHGGYRPDGLRVVVVTLGPRLQANRPAPGSSNP